jgi:hypothetical protein
MSAIQVKRGEQQRTAVAVAVANDPKVLLADEPTGELDSSTAAEVFAAFQTINAELGVTIVVVTHDPGGVRTGQSYGHDPGRPDRLGGTAHRRSVRGVRVAGLCRPDAAATLLRGGIGAAGPGQAPPQPDHVQVRKGEPC